MSGSPRACSTSFVPAICCELPIREIDRSRSGSPSPQRLCQLDGNSRKPFLKLLISSGRLFGAAIAHDPIRAPPGMTNEVGYDRIRSTNELERRSIFEIGIVVGID